MNKNLKTIFSPIIYLLEWMLVPKNSRAKFRDGCETLFVAFFLAMVIRAYILQAFYIPSSSMENTLLIGDHLIANKVKFHLTNPKRYDILIFQYPEDPINPEPENNYIKLAGAIYWNKSEPNLFKKFTYYMPKDFIKRCIGLPGDVIEIKKKNVYINNSLETFDKFQHIFNDFEPVRDYFGPVSIPAKGTVYNLKEINVYQLFIIQQYYSFYNEKFEFKYDIKINNEKVDKLALPNGYTINFENLKLYHIIYFYQICKFYNYDIKLDFYDFKLNTRKINDVKFDENCYFALGDNRDNSKDSRFWGALPDHFLNGTALFNYWPITRIKIID